MWVILAVVLFFLAYGIIAESKDARRSRSSKNFSAGDPEGPLGHEHTRLLVQRYNAAYDSRSESELAKIAEDLVGHHYACSSAKEWDDSILMENAVRTRSYVYHGCNQTYNGLTLLQIFRDQNTFLGHN